MWPDFARQSLHEIGMKFLQCCVIVLVSSSFLIHPKLLLAQDFPDIPDDPSPRYVSVLSGDGWKENGDGGPALLATKRPGYLLEVDSKNRLYFIENGRVKLIRRIELDGSVSTFFSSEHLVDFAIRGEYLYYIHTLNPNVIRVDLNTGESVQHRTFSPPVNWIYGRPSDIAVDSSGNIFLTGYIGEYIQYGTPSGIRLYQIFLIDAKTGDARLYAGIDDLEFIGEFYPGIPASEVPLNLSELEVDPRDDSLVWIDYAASSIVRLDTSSETLERVFSGDWSDFDHFSDFDIDNNGDILISSDKTNKIYRLSETTGDPEFKTIVGNGGWRDTGDGGSPLSASLKPSSLTVNSRGDIYISTSNRIRFVDVEEDLITTILGLPKLGCVSLTNREAIGGNIEFDSNQILYSQSQSSIRAIDENLDITYVVAGLEGEPGETEDGLPAFSNPIYPDDKRNFTVSPAGDLFYFSESGRIRMVDHQTGLLQTVATSGNIGHLTHDGSSHLYALRHRGGYPDYYKDIHRIDIETGELTEIMLGGTAPPVLGESIEGKALPSVNGFEIDRQGNFYLQMWDSSYNQDAGIQAGLYRIDSETLTWNLIAASDAELTPEFLGRGAMELDEDRGLIYILQIIEDSDSEKLAVIMVDIHTGLQTKFILDDLAKNLFEVPVGFSLRDFTVSQSGDLYISSYVFEEGEPLSNEYLLKVSTEDTDSQLGHENFAPGSEFGKSVARFENWLAVGAPNSLAKGGSIGEVLVYRDNDCRPILQERLEAPAVSDSKGFGAALAFAGDRLVVGSRESGSPGNSFRLGTYRIDEDTLSFDRDLSAHVSASGELTANNLTAFGSTFAVGVPAARGGAGEVVFFNTANLDDPTTLTSSGQGFSEFGRSLGLHNDLLAVGTRDAGSNGAVELLEQKGAAFQLKTSYPNRDGKKDFGASLAMDDTSLYVGAPDASGGLVYRYQISTDSNSPNLVGTIGEGSGTGSSSFGRSLGLSRGVLFVGDPDSVVTVSQKMGKGRQAVQNTLAEPTGQVHLYRVEDRAGERLDNTPLFSVKASSEQSFGASLDINNGRLLVGAPGTDDGRGDFKSVNQMIDPSLLSGLWFDPELDGEGYNVLMTDFGLVVFFYGYTADGQRLWLISDVISTDLRFGEDINVNVYKAMEGDFDSPVKSADALVKYGLLSMSFGSLRSATFTINGFDGNKISRNTYLTDTHANAASYSGLWFDPARDGEGFNVISGKHGTIIYYYGSTNDGERLWLISDLLSNDITDGKTLSGTMYGATGGDFYHPAPSSTALRNWGTIEARFDECDDGRFILKGSDGNKTSDVVKLAGVAEATCH